MINILKQQGHNPTDKSPLYYFRWTRIATSLTHKLAKAMARNSSAFTMGEASGVIYDMPKYIVDELLAGNAVTLDGLGTFKLKVNGKSNADKDKLTISSITGLDIKFVPDAEIIDRLNREAEFKIVDKATAEGEQDTGNDNGDENGNDNGGQNANTPTPTPPSGGTTSGGDDMGEY